jgi:hypothetical protein
MPAEPPIACSLSATELPARLAEMAALGAAALTDTRQDAAHAELRFAAGAGVRERVEAVVAAESHCCAFLAMHVTGEPDAVVLTIDAPEGAEVVLAELVDAFRSRPQAAG